MQLREIRDSDGFRAMWQTVESLWADTTERVRLLPEDALHERVDGEWSFVETLRHLVFITDSWASRTILDVERPFHPLALPQTAYAPADSRALGIDLGARPSLDEVLEARADRQDVVGRILDGVTDADLGRPCTGPPHPAIPRAIDRWPSAWRS